MQQGFGSLVGYVRATVAVAAVDAIGIGAGLAILGVPLALPLASLVFIGAFIPIVGALLTGFLAVLVALVTKGLLTALIVLGIIIGVMQLEGHVLQPLLLGRAVRLHPLAVVLAITTGIVLAGIVGGLLGRSDRRDPEHRHSLAARRRPGGGRGGLRIPRERRPVGPLFPADTGRAAMTATWRDPPPTRPDLSCRIWRQEICGYPTPNASTSAQLLQRAVGQGMLSLGEFTERMDTALAAKTRGELNAVLVDLPGMQLDPAYAGTSNRRPLRPAPSRSPRLARREPPQSSAPGQPHPRTHVHHHPQGPAGTSRRRLFLNSRMSSVTLDFTEAVMRTQVVEI